MTGWLPEVGGVHAGVSGCRQAYRSCVRSDIGRPRTSEGARPRGRRRPFKRESEVGTRDGGARVGGGGGGWEGGHHTGRRGGGVEERAGRALGEVWEAEIEPR